MALKLSTFICKTHGPELIAPNILNQVLLLVRSPLLQGLALESSIEFFISIVHHKHRGLEYKDIIAVFKLTNKFLIFSHQYIEFIYFKMLTKPIREQQSSLHQSSSASVNVSSPNINDFSNNNLAVHKQAFYSIAKIIAALTVTHQTEGKLVIQQFIRDIKDPKSRDSTRLLALLCLGETGKYM